MKKRKKYYIAYIDLLGTKNYAENYNYKEYLGLIINFQTELLRMTQSKIGNKDRVHFFSDCAYIESDNIEVLIEALKSLRTQLRDSNLFLKGAVMEGKLGAVGKFSNRDEFISYYNYDINDKEVTNATRCVFAQQGLSSSNKISGSLFFSTDICQLYTIESELKGSAILIDEKLINEKIKTHIVESGYISNKNTFSNFYDIRYDEKSITGDFLDKILAHYTKSNMQNKNYGRHYLSILMSCINSTNFAGKSYDIDSDDAPPILAKILKLKETHKQIYNYAIGLEYLYLALINKFYYDIDENSVLTKEFVKIILKKQKFLSKYLNNLSSIPKKLLHNKSRNLFINDVLEIQNNASS